jgi:hypothetical protein
MKKSELLAFKALILKRLTSIEKKLERLEEQMKPRCRVRRPARPPRFLRNPGTKPGKLGTK